MRVFREEGGRKQKGGLGGGPVESMTYRLPTSTSGPCTSGWGERGNPQVRRVKWWGRLRAQG
jgi:hypothetical protein